MLFAGLDIHKRVVEAAVLDAAGKVLHRERFECNRKELERFARRRLGKKAKVALEATTNTWAVVGVLEPLVGEVVVSNPLRTRAIAEAKVKTDKVDALVLAQLLRADFLPSVWKPDPGTRARRSTTTHRAALVHDRTRIKNRIHAVLHQRLIECPVGDLFSVKGREWLENLRIQDEHGKAALATGLRLLANIEKEVEHVTDELAVDGYDEPRVRLLMTLPGVDVPVAQTLLGALGDAARFKSADHAAAYLGLVPSTKQSADHCYHGPITKQGRGHTRWLLVQAAQHIAKHSGPLGVFFRRLASKKNRNVAVVATARKLVTVAWHMLRNNEPYRYADPRPTQTKLARHRVRATGERRIGGCPKGVGRHPNYGKGRPARTIPSIDQLYEQEGLPPTTPLKDGELAMLRERKLINVVARNQQARRVPKPRTEKSP
jgi:transposase